MSRSEKQSTDIVVDILVVVFGISSWVAVRGLWVELPVMVERLPEGWTLASYIVITSQLANIGPVIFSLIRRCVSQKVIEGPAIHVTLFAGTTASIFLAFFWDKTTLVGGEEHSTALLILTFFLSVVDCTSSVLYLPFMANFHERYIVLYFVGQGMSGLLPSLVALIQGVGGDAQCRNGTDGQIEAHYEPPRFPAMTFYLILAFMISISWIAYILLNVLPRSKKEQITQSPVKVVTNPAVDENFATSVSLSKSWSSNELAQSNGLLKPPTQLTSCKYYTLLALQMYLCFLQNSQLSIQTYSCLPYGSLPYHLTVNLSSIASPVGCFIALFIAVRSLTSISSLTVFISGFSVYIFATAVLSPNPPLVNLASGSFLVVSSWIFVVTATAYAKAVIAKVLRKDGNDSALFWCGAVTQFGSATGALVSFLLVNFGGIFHAKPTC